MTFPRLKPGGWTTNEKLTSPQMTALDGYVSKALDKTGDNIDGYIGISGPGMIDGYTAGTKFRVSASGASIEATAAGSKFKTTNGAVYEIGDTSTYPTFTTPRTRNRVFGWDSRAYQYPNLTAGTATFAGWFNYGLSGLTDNTNPNWIRAYDPNFVSSGGQWTDIPIPVHHGATLSSVDFRYCISVSHPNLPDFKLGFQVMRRDTAPSGESYLASGGSILYVQGTTGANYYNSGSTQTLAITCDQNNVIDTANYVYFVRLISEHGNNAINASNMFFGGTLHFTNITDMRFA